MFRKASKRIPAAMRSARCRRPVMAGLLALLQLLCCCCWQPATAERFLMGYLTGSERKGDDKEYPQPGKTISGAINLAMHEITTSKPLVNGKY